MSKEQQLRERFINLPDYQERKYKYGDEAYQYWLEEIHIALMESQIEGERDVIKKFVKSFNKKSSEADIETYLNFYLED